MLNIFTAGFMLFWLTGWTVGGTFALSVILHRGITAAAFAVWLLLTSSFAYSTTRPCEGEVATVFFGCWLVVSFIAAVLYFFRAQLTTEAMKKAQDAVRATAFRCLARLDMLALRFRYFVISYFRQNNDAERPLTMITVSVLLPNGDFVLEEAKVLSHDYVLVIRQLVEKQLGLRHSGRQCKLALAGTLLTDDTRIHDAGVEDNSVITAVVLDEMNEAPEIAPKAMGEPPAPGPPGPPVAAKAFLCFWLCGWLLGEIFAAGALMSALAGCMS